MLRKHVPIISLAILFLLIAPSIVHAATITACTLNKDTYYHGETGDITVTLYNDKEAKIRITELTATIEYYYSDDTVYVQKFYSSEDLPIEVQPGESDNFLVPFSLPTNIAAGYTEGYVKAKTELWNSEGQRWLPSEHPADQVLLYIESPYKHHFEEQVAANDALQEQLDEQLSVNADVTNLMYLFGVTTLVFAGIAGLLYYLMDRRARFIKQPIA